MKKLPVDTYLPEIYQCVAGAQNVIVEAAPGTGKTTRVAPYLAFQHGGREGGRRVILVQPRRIAARAAANRIAQEHGFTLGKEVGYQVRFDNRSTAKTGLLCVTPGILLRRIQTDALLDDVDVVVLDEFHERSLEYDLLTGMLRRVQSEMRKDLKLVIMSATLDSSDLDSFLDGPRAIQVQADTHAVKMHYVDMHALVVNKRLSPSRRIAQAMAKQIALAARSYEGDILAFLPGLGEIRQVQSLLEPEAKNAEWLVQPLYGDLAHDQQDRVLMPTQQRKIVLATNIAETSLTIDGIRIVVDSGWARIQRVDPQSGLNRLVLEPISQASAAQRAGRAGRTAPGICYRLWNEHSHRSRPSHLAPEVQRMDLSNALLQVFAWGEAENEFNWLTHPTTEAIQSAKQTLETIGAVRESRISELGKEIVRLPLHPRLGRLVLAAADDGIAQQGALAAALLSERDVFDRNHLPPVRHRYECDLYWRIAAMQSRDPAVNRQAEKNVQRVAQEILQSLGPSRRTEEQDPVIHEAEQLGVALLAGFPDRLARRRSATDSRALMVGGRGVKLSDGTTVKRASLFLCLQVDDKGRDARVDLATSVRPDWLTPPRLRETTALFYHPTQAAVVSRNRQLWLDLILTETPIDTPASAEAATVLARAAAPRFFDLLPAKDKSLQQWITRVRWLAAHSANLALPSFSATEVAVWLESWCFGLRSISELRKLPWADLLPTVLTAEQTRLLAVSAPETIRLPGGREVRLEYEVGKPPILAAKIQEFFGWDATPRIGGGPQGAPDIPLLLHLLAPNNRCQQVTDDLASFWSNTYPQVRKELRGRYPKHAWPEDPLTAPAMRKPTKPRTKES